MKLVYKTREAQRRKLRPSQIRRAAGVVRTRSRVKVPKPPTLEIKPEPIGDIGDYLERTIRDVHKRRILTEDNHDPAKTLDVRQVSERVVALAQVLSEKRFYPPQVALTYRIVESLLLHDGAVVTALFSRQSGKTESVGSICAAIAIIFPLLARQFPDDWHFNITDEQGTYRGFRDGVLIGIYGPKQEQAAIMFDRVRHCMETKSAKRILLEMGIKDDIANGAETVLSNGSVISCQSASEQSKIEGATHHLLVAEEAQDITNRKMRKSLHPMTASTMGTIVKVGTATGRRCDFFEAGQLNVAEELAGGQRNHFVFPADVCSRYNSLYRNYIAREKRKLGVDSDEFRMSYNCEWLFERGMFIPLKLLLDDSIAIRDGAGSVLFPNGIASRNLSVVMGIDWAQMYDSTVITLVAVDWNRPYQVQKGVYLFRKHILGWMDLSGNDYEEQFDILTKYIPIVQNLRKIVVDGNTCGAPMVSRLKAFVKANGLNIHVEGVTFSRQAKSDGYRILSGDFFGKRISYPASPAVRRTREYQKFIKEMSNLEKQHEPGGFLKVGHPDVAGAHDDYPDSLMLASLGASQPFGGGRVVFEDNIIGPRGRYRERTGR